MSALLTIQQAAAFLDISAEELRAMVTRREIASVPSFTVGTLWRARQKLRESRAAQAHLDEIEARHPRAQE